MKATSLLERQHRKVETMLRKLESGRGDSGEILRQLADELAAHMAIEQQIFYPAVRKLNEDLVAESFEEHAMAEIALKRLIATSPSDRSFQAKVATLKTLVENHLAEEEEKLFPLVEKKIDDDDLLALGRQLKTAFDEAVESGFEALVPKSMASTSADIANKPTARKNGQRAATAHAHR